MVRKFAQSGYDVYFTYNSGRGRADEVIAGCAEFGVNVIAIKFDQGEAGSAQGLFDAMPVVPTVVVPNAALGSATVESACPGDRFGQDKALMGVNALGAMWVVEAFREKLRAKIAEEGTPIGMHAHKVVLISSVGGGIAVFPKFRHADGMSKAALSFYAKQLAAETVQEGIDVFCVCPGATDTAMFQASTLSHMTPEQRSAFDASLPKKRVIDPSEVAEIVFWLSDCPAASIMHGTHLDASMGLGVRPGMLTEMGGH